MSNVLTDEDIELAMQGNSLPMDHDELKEFATAIEIAVLAKVGTQKPVAWLHDDPKRIDVIHDEVKKLVEASYAKYGFESGVQRQSVNRGEHYTIPLYAHPAPQQAIQEIDAAIAKLRSAQICHERAVQVLIEEAIDILSSSPKV